MWRGRPFIVGFSVIAVIAMTHSLAPADVSVTEGTVDIPHPEAYSQVLALSDVHGMYEPLLRLLAQAKVIDSAHAWSAGKTLLIVDGDSIDKGPRSLEVLDLWIALSEQARAAGGRIVHLLGNHEAEFLAYGKQDTKSDELRAELKSQGLRVRELRGEDSPRGRFLHQLPVAAKVGRWLFCHSGFFPEMSWADFSARATKAIRGDDYANALLLGEDSVLEAKDWWSKGKPRRRLEARLAAQGIYGVVQGHQPKAYGIEGHVGAIDGGHLIKLDTGMAPQAGAHPGELLRFPAPAEMNEMKTPRLEAIEASGRTRKLEPEP